MRLMVCAAGLLCLVLWGSAGGQAVYSPWVLSEHTADFRDAARFRQFPAWADLEDQDLAMAVWKYLTDPVTGTYHFTDMYEGGEVHWEVKLVQDPMKILNVYGFAVCSASSSMTQGLFKGMGFEQARLRGFGTYHATPEIYWDGGWHYVDIDERAIILDDDGNIASADDFPKHPQWWERSAREVKPFYPQNGGIKGARELAKRAPAYHGYDWYYGGYTPDFVLRPGERVERFFEPQGYWRYCDAYEKGSARRIVNRDPRGPKSGGHSVNSYGNARFDYKPRIASDFADYSRGVWSDHNVKLAEDGLALAADGQGSSAFYFQFPYIIAPQNGDLDNPHDDWDAAVVRYKAAPNTVVKVSTDHGHTWTQLAPTDHDETIPGALREKRGDTVTLDLTQYVAGKYAYWLRFDYTGKAGETVLRDLNVRTWTQLAPISLPRLAAGENRLAFQSGDKHGLNTWTVPITPDGNDLEQMKPYLVGPYDYDKDRRRSRFEGPVTFRLDAPQGSQIEWLHVSAGLWALRDQEPATSGDRFLIALDEPSDFKEVWQARVPDWIEHWYFRGEQEVKLDRPARTVYVRIEPAHGMLNAHFYLHVSRQNAGEPADPAPVTVTHRFETGGQARTVTRNLPGPGPYTVTCDDQPRNISVAFEVPSVRVANEPRP